MSTSGQTFAGEVYQRPTSGQASTQDRSKLQSKTSPLLAPKATEYTVLIRLPFARKDFVDPDPVVWDAVKDKALWKIISKGSDSRELDWEDIAKRFDVSLHFLMKQAAWLYERHFAGVRKQMQRLATTSTPSPVPSNKIEDVPEGKLPPLTVTTSGPRRTGSRHSQNTVSSRVRDSPIPSEEQSITPKLNAPSFSRTPSTATITQSKLFTSARFPNTRSSRSAGAQRLPLSPRQRDVQLSDNLDEERSAIHDDSASEEEPSIVQSQAFRRPPLSSKPTLGGLSSEGDDEDGGEQDDDDEESSSAGFLPFAIAARHDPSATLRCEPGTGAYGARHKAKKQATSSSTSSAGSMPPPLSSVSKEPSGPKPGPLSPKHRAQLRQHSHSTNKDGSDGTPSMGSSFSDLDDAGISASAIEDAVLSQMQAGGASIASRVSGLSQAFRSQR